jgi:hypothetical protein
MKPPGAQISQNHKEFTSIRGNFVVKCYIKDDNYHKGIGAAIIDNRHIHPESHNIGKASVKT